MLEKQMGKKSKKRSNQIVKESFMTEINREKIREDYRVREQLKRAEKDK